MSSDDVEAGMGAPQAPDADDAAVECALRSALGAPAMPDELTGWQEVSSAYRKASAGSVRRLHLVAGIPLSAAVAASLLVPTGAVAAAYTGRLPAHVQHWAHRALASLGVPAERHPAVQARPALPSAPSPTPRLSSSRRHLTAFERLPAPQRARAVRLCADLLRTPPAQQEPVLTSLHRLLPAERHLHRTCVAVLVEPRHEHPLRTTSARPSLSPSATPLASKPSSPAPS